jgi:hypothetical protein
MNEKVYSSTGSGYLILSKLRDSTYSFSVGFPQNQWPEQYFTVPVKSKDHGFLVKNFGDKGWGIFDLQTLAVQMGTASTGKAVLPKTENKDVSAFADILSKASDDPLLNEKIIQPKTDTAFREVVKKDEPKSEIKEPVVKSPVVKTDEPKTEIKDPLVNKPIEVSEKTIVKTEELKTEIKDPPVTKPLESPEKTIVKTDEPKIEIKDPPVNKPLESTEKPILKTEDPKPEIKEPLVVKTEEIKEQPEQPYKRSIITRRSESSTTEGFGLVFLDNNSDGSIDTIRILIPNPKPFVNPVKDDPKPDIKFLDIESKNNVDTTAKMPVTVTKDNPPLIITDTASVAAKPSNNNCAATATDADFFKLRKQMAAIISDDDMVTAARKTFKTKCFTVAQVKNLSTLFLNDDGKYKFFDAAYPYVSDPANFPTLEDQLKNSYYINRFKAMLK